MCFHLQVMQTKDIEKLFCYLRCIGFCVYPWARGGAGGENHAIMSCSLCWNFRNANKCYYRRRDIEEPDGNEEAVFGRGGEGEEVGLPSVVVAGRRVVQHLDRLVRRMTVDMYHL